MEFLLLGLATAFNFGVLVRKLRLHRYFDAIVDASTMAIICVLFSGTFSALAVGMVASMTFSIYLYFFPVHFPRLLPERGKEDEENYDDDDDDDF